MTPGASLVAGSGLALSLLWRIGPAPRGKTQLKERQGKRDLLGKPDFPGDDGLPSSCHFLHDQLISRRDHLRFFSSLFLASSLAASFVTVSFPSLCRSNSRPIYLDTIFEHNRFFARSPIPSFSSRTAPVSKRLNQQDPAPSLALAASSRLLYVCVCVCVVCAWDYQPLHKRSLHSHPVYLRS